MRRVLPRIVLFVGIALILVYTFRSRPSAVDVVYDYGPAARGLVAAQMTYLQGGDIVHRVQFDYHLHHAGATQAHHLRLHEGDYQVEISLTYAGAPPADLGGQRTRTPQGETRVTLRRPLLVRSGGELHIYLAPSSE